MNHGVVMFRREETDSRIEWAKEEFRSFLRQAFEKGLALVTFTY